MAATQRPCTDLALSEPAANESAWESIPAWFVFGELDLNIPVTPHRSMAERAGSPRTHEIRSHAVAVSQPGAVADLVLEAIAAVAAAPSEVA